MNPVTREQRDEAIAHFKYEGTLVKDCPYGSGHINDTFLLVFEIAEMGRIKVILQRMNSTAFPKPVEVMENITGVTSFLKKKIIENGGDPERETLNVIPAVDGKPYYIDSTGDYWRSYKFITDASTYDLVEKPEQFYESAVAFGNFQSLLSDYPAETLHETIEKFHDTRNRFALFKKAVEEDVMGRAASVEKEIRFVLEREEIANCFAEMLDRHELPLRVTHNDTKLNNVMLDDKTGKGICVIDLDTVMPGLAMNDFGDSIRFGASTALEDETDLTKVSCSMEYFEAYTKGFVEGCDGKLTARAGVNGFNHQRAAFFFQHLARLPTGAKAAIAAQGVVFVVQHIKRKHLIRHLLRSVKGGHFHRLVLTSHQAIPTRTENRERVFAHRNIEV